MDNKTKILIIFPPVLIIILILIATSIPLKKSLTEIERQTLEFTPSDIKIKERELVYIKRELKNPLKRDISIAVTRKPSPTEDNLASQIGYNDTALSLILISDETRMAIIKGVIVKEGDSIDGIKVAKIEPDRVLLKSLSPRVVRGDKTTQWLYMEKEK